MTTPNDDWQQKFKEMTQAQVSESLRRRIVEDAMRRDRPSLSRRKTAHQRAWKSWLAGMAGVCAAAVVAGVVWTDRSLPSVSAPRNSPVVATQPWQNSTVGLQQSQLIATGIKVVHQANVPGGIMIQATVQNIGTTVVKSQDVFGVLGFTTQPGQDLLLNSNWIDFVNGPSEPVSPGDIVTWSFNPIGVVVDSQGHVIGKPKLTFFKSRLVSPVKADKTLTKAPGVLLQNVQVTVRSVSKTGRSFKVQAMLVNTGSEPVVLNHLLSVVWFSPQADASWTQQPVVRFFDQVQAVNPNVTEVAPGQSVEVYLPPSIGPNTPNFLQWNANVLIIRHTW